MGESFKILAQGYIPTVMTTVYTVPVSASAVVKNFRIANVGAASGTVSVGVNGTSDANLISKDTVFQVGQSAIDDTIALGPSDSLAFGASTASGMVFTVLGVEIG